MKIVALVVLLVAGGCRGGLYAPCTSDGQCRDSFCNGTWKEGASCREAKDCPGYVDVNYGSRPLGPNKRCLDGKCYQVGRCSNDHS